MKIKICGITNQEDALACYSAGTDALGFIFAPISPRYISPDKCAQIISSLPPFCERIGVFVDEEISNIIDIAKQCRLSAIQIHGKIENVEYIKTLYNKLSLPIIRAIRIKEIDNCQILKDLPYAYLQAVLIDGMGQNKIVNPQVYELSYQLAQKPLILAGALNSRNIKEIIQKFNPQAIDLCSSLEEIAGKKDLNKVKQFFSIIKNLKK